MRDELTECAWGYEEVLTYLLRELLITMNRRIHENTPRIAGFLQDEVDHAKDYFRERPGPPGDYRRHHQRDRADRGL